MDNDHQISKYDRLYGSMREVCIYTKPSTVQIVEPVTGRAETFIVQTMRHAEKGDYVFVQCLDENATTMRMGLPPAVANAIASQRDSLTTKRRRIASKAAMRARMDRGELPGFMKKRAKK
jgi:hypothetical protein